MSTKLKSEEKRCRQVTVYVTPVEHVWLDNVSWREKISSSDVVRGLILKAMLTKKLKKKPTRRGRNAAEWTGQGMIE